MATIYLSLSGKSDSNSQKEIRIRFKHGKIDQQVKSNIFIPAEHWDHETQQIIIPNYRLMNYEKKELKQYLSNQREKLNTLLSVINTSFNEMDKSNVGTDWLKDCIDKYYIRGKYAPVEEEQKQSFFDTFDDFLKKRKLSEVREKNFMVLKRALQRYEMFISISEKRAYKLELDSITTETIEGFEDFLCNEYTLYDEYKEIYNKFPAIVNTQRKTPKPQQRGINTINALFNKLRAFFNWCLDNEKTTNRPFKNYESKPDLYGTPIYITIEERNKIYSTDFSKRPNLAVQRDIFIFQCLIGCRISDLYQFTKKSIINGAIEYIPRKTKDGHPITVRVPLNSIAKEIIKKYSDYEGETLLPYISEQNYNDAIKDIFKLSEVTRIVTVLNSTTRKEEKKPINEIASSHLARRCFVGNLYKQVKDPNLVGALSGHKEVSKAFARYREIDEEIKTELVKMLE
ncbi:MAG: phage integrase SAM-like domain-containing protein [Tannerellaceae bacterium]|jgi:integrase|nr:phage integrase SAM-like domain-containing protein [Tannerellaceae bacterium]